MADRVEAVVVDNADLFEAHLRLEVSTQGVAEFLHAVADALSSRVMQQSSSTEAEIQAKLQEEAASIMQEESENYGLDPNPDMVATLQGLLRTQLGTARQQTSVESAQVVEWLYGDDEVEAGLEVHEVDEELFAAMEADASEGTQRLLTEANAGNAHSRLSEGYAYE